MGVSKNSGTPNSSILIGFSIINHPFWGTPIFGNTHIDRSSGYPWIEGVAKICLDNTSLGSSIMVQHLIRSLCKAWPRWFHQFTLSYTSYTNIAPWKCLLPTVNVQGLRLTVSLREGVPGNHHCCNGGKGPRSSRKFIWCRPVEKPKATLKKLHRPHQWWLGMKDRSRKKLVKKNPVTWEDYQVTLFLKHQVFFLRCVLFFQTIFRLVVLLENLICPVMSFDRQFLQMDHAKTCDFFCVSGTSRSTYHFMDTLIKDGTSHRKNPDFQGYHF